jgi:hypothetical protein
MEVCGLYSMRPCGKFLFLCNDTLFQNKVIDYLANLREKKMYYGANLI